MNNIKNNKLKNHFRYLYTLKYIKILSYISARSLKNKLNQSHKEKYVYYYGFQIIYGGINKWLLLLTAGLILHILPETVFATLAFMSLRVWIGGGHFNSYTKCSWISLICLVTAGLLARYTPYDHHMLTFIFSTVFLIALIYAPIEHKNRPIKDKNKIKFKHISLMVILLLYGTTWIFNADIKNAIQYGVLLAGIVGLPIFNKSKTDVNCL